MKTYGYARVSTREQNEDRQLIALSGFPVARKNIFLDKLSGKISIARNTDGCFAG